MCEGQIIYEVQKQATDRHDMLELQSFERKLVVCSSQRSHNTGDAQKHKRVRRRHRDAILKILQKHGWMGSEIRSGPCREIH